MPLFLRLLLAMLPFVWMTDSDSKTDDTKDKDQKLDSSKKFEWTDEQQAEIGRIAAKEARKAAEQARKDRDAEIEQERKDREAEAERKKQEAAGQFDEVRTSLEQERDTAKSDLEAANTELKTLREYVTADIEAVTKAVKENAGAKALLDFYPGDDASVPDKLSWARKAKTNLATLTKDTKRGAGFDPVESNHTINIDKEVATAKRRGGYSAF